MNEAPKDATCPLCRAPTLSTIYRGHHGFQAGTTYDIELCTTCDTAVADPLAVDEKLYELIYSKAPIVPGYDRYAVYARQVLQEARPLDFLASREDVYWAVKKATESYAKKTNKGHGEIEVLEIGCGYGYLTYSLSRAGFKVRGLDISSAAIERAKAAYGDLYTNGDLLEVAKSTTKQTYDVVVMTEVIEHVPNLLELVTAAKSLLKPGGWLVVTTPNKSIFPSTQLWHTDPPPIHLWWLSESSMRAIGQRVGLLVTFTDFTEFNTGRRSAPAPLKPTKPQTFNERGDVVFKDALPLKAARWIIGKVPVLRKTSQRLQTELFLREKYRREREQKSQALCAIYTQPS